MLTMWEGGRGRRKEWGVGTGSGRESPRVHRTLRLGFYWPRTHILEVNRHKTPSRTELQACSLWGNECDQRGLPGTLSRISMPSPQFPLLCSIVQTLASLPRTLREAGNSWPQEYYGVMIISPHAKEAENNPSEPRAEGMPAERGGRLQLTGLWGGGSSRLQG